MKGDVDCINCNDQPGATSVLEVETRDGPKTIELSLCHECLEAFLLEDWITEV